MLEGRYQLEISDYSGANVADIRDGNTSILAQGFLINRPMSETLDVIVRTDGGAVAGTVTPGGRASIATVVTRAPGRIAPLGCALQDRGHFR